MNCIEVLMFLNTKELKNMLYTSFYTCISVSDKILYKRNIKVAENMEIEIFYTDKYYNYAYEVYKITNTARGVTCELIGDEIYWTSYNNKNNNDTFLVLKYGVVVKEEKENEKTEEVKREIEEEEEDYKSDSTEIIYSSDEEDKQQNNPIAKRTTAFLVFASKNKKDKTDLSIMNLGPSPIHDINWLTEMGEMWKNLSEEDHVNYAKKAQLINSKYDEFVDVKLD